MNSESPSSLPPRRAVFAVLLTFLGAGIGHIYSGRGKRGALLLALSFAWAPITFALSLQAPAAWVLYALVGVFVFTLGVSLFALIDSGLAARSAQQPFLARSYNHGGLYLGLALLNVLWFFGAAYAVREQAFEAYVIPTRSMTPGVEHGDRILVNKHVGPLRRGDLVVFVPPDQPDRVFFKRVVGLPGETLEFKDGLVHVDGQPLPNEQLDGEGIFEERAGERSYRVFREAAGTTGAPVQVPAGHVFVLGDNRRNSVDSRKFGPVPTSAVHGIAQYVFWPGSRIGLLR